MLIAVSSVKGSPGATTLAVLLAATWPETPAGQRPVVVEMDCSGGDLGGRCWLPDAPGLTSLATAARTGHAVLVDHTAELPCGVGVVVAPAARQASTVAVGLLAETGPDAWLGNGTAIVDVGRLDPGVPSSALVSAADAVVMVSHGDEASLLRLADAGQAREKARLVLVGDSPYSPEEIAQAVGMPVAASLPSDPRAARAIWGREVPGRGWTKRGLPAAVRALARALAAVDLRKDRRSQERSPGGFPSVPPGGLPNGSRNGAEQLLGRRHLSAGRPVRVVTSSPETPPITSGDRS